MKTSWQMFPLPMAAILVVGIIASTTAARGIPQNMPMPSPTPKATPKQTPSPVPMQMEMPMPSPTAEPAPKPVDLDNVRTQHNKSTDDGFPEPVSDNERYGWTLVDILEFRPGRGGDSDFRWDVEGAYGIDKNRFWYKSEGERNTAFKADYDIDLQLLYGRLISPYFNFQTGIRLETQTFRGVNVTRPQGVVGFAGTLPYFVELESAIFIDPKGNVSGRASLTKDFLITNRWIAQARFETNVAVQKVGRFTTGRGLNNIESGLRVRYEFSRKFAPYIGVTFDKSFFETARLVRIENGDPSQVRLAVGVRMLF